MNPRRLTENIAVVFGGVSVVVLIAMMLIGCMLVLGGLHGCEMASAGDPRPIPPPGDTLPPPSEEGGGDGRGSHIERCWDRLLWDDLFPDDYDEWRARVIAEGMRRYMFPDSNDWWKVIIDDWPDEADLCGPWFDGDGNGGVWIGPTQDEWRASLDDVYFADLLEGWTDDDDEQGGDAGPVEDIDDDRDSETPDDDDDVDDDEPVPWWWPDSDDEEPVALNNNCV